MTYKKKSFKPSSLSAVLEQVDSQVNSAFFVNPPLLSSSPSILLLNPFTTLELHDNNSKDFFRKVEKFRAKGNIVVVIMDYEAGFIFSPKFTRYREELKSKTLGKALVFDKSSMQYIDLTGVSLCEGENEDIMISDLQLNQSKEEYCEAITTIKEKIKAGETYQINHTIAGRFKYSASPSKIFTTLLFNQTSKYSAYINLEDKQILSLSPELFFSLKHGKILVAPMKGTMKRPAHIARSIETNHLLSYNPKEQAENLMITDLLRNDLHKICTKTPLNQVSLFKVEQYETVYQLISEIRGSLDDETGFYDIYKALYPCGSITGAPKISSMQIIKQLEKRERGLYTGTIGLIQKDHSTFSIAIRTLELDKKQNTGSIGLGSGVVWDSDPEKEYEECLTKGNFFTSPGKEYKIFDTMLVENNTIPLLQHHRERLTDAASRHLFYFDDTLFENALITALFKIDPKRRYRLKLLLEKYGKITSVIEELSPLPEKIQVGFSKNRLSSENTMLNTKTTVRGFYDGERAFVIESGMFDLIYCNERDEVCEGAISNVFVKKEGEWFTPPLACGLLPGIARKLFIAENRAEEKIIYKEDIINADEIILTNALRGPVKIDKLIF
ncbi:aminodeoxychorismate synthase component I [Ignavibacteriales bacterium]